MRRLLLLCLVVMAGCRTLPPPETMQRPADPGQASFDLNGRISITHDGKRDAANLRWSHTPDGDEMSLVAPLGQTVARLVRNGQGATLETSEQRYVAGNIGELTQQALGWTLPLEGLPYWVFALPSPESESDVESAPGGQVSVLRQDGWEMRYLRYASEAADSLPMRMRLAREGVEIQLMVDEWNIPR